VRGKISLSIHLAALLETIYPHHRCDINCLLSSRCKQLYFLSQLLEQQLHEISGAAGKVREVSGFALMAAINIFGLSVPARRKVRKTPRRLQRHARCVLIDARQPTTMLLNVQLLAFPTTVFV
jgi:hypothetical protein